MLLPPFRVHHRNVTQVAVELLEIETAAYHEPVGDLEAAEIDGDLHDAAHGAVEQGADGERPRPSAGQGLQEITRGEAGVDDVLDQKHVFILNRLVQIFRDADHALRAAVIGVTAEAGDGQEIDLDGTVHGAGERGEKEDGAFQHADELDFAAFEAVVDFTRHLANALAYLRFGKPNSVD